MAPVKSLRGSDLRGVARLATDATAGLADLVEAMHERIARVPGLPGARLEGRTRGITGLVYKSIRGVTRVVGGGTDTSQGRQYDVTRDGRFLINTVLDEAAAPITLLMNWNPEAKQ